MGRSNAGRRRPGTARATSSRAPGTTAPPGGALPLEEATQPRSWHSFELRPLTDPSDARPLFEFAAVPWPDPRHVAFGWGAAPVNGRMIAAVLAERAGRAVFLHGPLIAATDAGALAADPLQLAGELLTCALRHAGAIGADTAFTRPQGLDRVWVRFGFIPVPEAALPAALAGREGAGLYGWRGGSALWTLRDTGDRSAA